MRDVTDDEIYDLRTDAGMAGDADMIQLCERALWFADGEARRKCEQVILDNRARKAE